MKFCSEYAVWNKNGKSDIKWYNPVNGMGKSVGKSDYNSLNATEDNIIRKIFIEECDSSIFKTHYIEKIRQ